MMNDYQLFLNEYGLTEEYVRSMSENTHDLITGIDLEAVYIDRSSIEGIGVFSNSNIKAGFLICPARINGFRTVVGRYTNHSPTPNAIFTAMENNDLGLLAIKPIAAGEEITIDYRQAMEINGAGFEKIHNFLDIPKSHGIDISSMTNREKIDVIEWIILNKMDNIVDDLQITNYINGGVYAREMKAPQGIVITGKIHEHDHINILSEGEISVMTDDGMRRIKAPYTFTSKSGIRRIGYTHSDITWTSIHSVNTDDINELEKELFTVPDIDWVADLFKQDIEALT